MSTDINPDSGRTTEGQDPGPAGTAVTSGRVHVVTDRLHFETRGSGDVVNLTGQVSRLVKATGLRTGIVTVFFPGATGAITTLEFEPGVVQERLRPLWSDAPSERRMGNRPPHLPSV